MEKQTKELCKAEKEFLRCKCKRCVLYRECMIHNVFNNYIQSIINESLSKSLEQKA